MMRLVFCLNDIEGGVLSVVRNIIKYAKLNNNAKVILCANLSSVNHQSRVKSIDEIEQKNIIRFEYSNDENFYCISKRFKKLLLKDELIIANDWLALGVMSNLGLNNKLTFILHGDYPYYYELAIKNKYAIDKFICVSQYIRNQLINKLPQRKNDVINLKHAIPAVQAKSKFNFNDPLNCLFIGRLTSDKGYNILPKINHKLKQRNIEVNWYIVGEYEAKDQEIWQDNSNAYFLGNIPNELLLKEIRNYDLFVLPTKAEGFPVSLVECMKAGLVPLITNLPSGIPELVEPQHNGLLFNEDDTDGYASGIELLSKDRNLLVKYGERCLQKANQMFDPDLNAREYINTFEQLRNNPCKNKKRAKLYGSRLDHPLIPNLITKAIRKFQ